MSVDEILFKAQKIQLRLNGHLTVVKRSELISELKDLHSQLLNEKNKVIYENLKREIFR